MNSVAHTAFFSDRINYSAANEDGRSELSGFSLRGGERVLCIAGGGERGLDLLTGEAAPRELVVVDANAVQIAVFDLKRTAIAALSPPEAFELIGLSAASPRRRDALFRAIVDRLPDGAREFFAGRGRAGLRRGVLYAGRFERFCRMMSLAVRAVMGRAVDGLFEAEGVEAQRELVVRTIEGPKWRAFLAALCRPVWFRLLLDDPAFHRRGVGDVSAYLRGRIDRALWHVPVRDNFLLALLLRGRYMPERGVVPVTYANGALERVRRRLAETEVTTRVMGLADLLAAPGDDFDAMSLSDVFSYVDASSASSLFAAIAGRLRPGGVAIFRELLTAMDVDAMLTGLPLRRDRAAERRLAEQDSSFVYRFRVLRRAGT